MDGIHPIALPKIAELVSEDPRPFMEGMATLEAAQKAIPNVPTIKEVNAGRSVG